MADKNNDAWKREKVHLRSILVCAEKLPSVSSGEKIFNKEIFGVRTVLRESGNRKRNLSIGHMKIRLPLSEYPLSGAIRKRIPPEFRLGKTFEHTPIICDFEVGSKHALLISASQPRLISLILEAHDVEYYCWDLRTICDDQFLTPESKRIVLRRLNGRISDKEGNISSVTLYGQDVVLSPILIDMLSPIPGKEGQTIHPFHHVSVQNNVLMRWLDPFAFRVSFDERFGLNVDRFGNMSCFLREESDWECVYSIVEYMTALNCIGRMMESPLKRSKSALSRVDI